MTSSTADRQLMVQKFTQLRDSTFENENIYILRIYTSSKHFNHVKRVIGTCLFLFFFFVNILSDTSELVLNMLELV